MMAPVTKKWVGLLCLVFVLVVGSMVQNYSLTHYLPAFLHLPSSLTIRSTPRTVVGNTNSSVHTLSNSEPVTGQVPVSATNQQSSSSPSRDGAGDSGAGDADDDGDDRLMLLPSVQQGLGYRGQPVTDCPPKDGDRFLIFQCQKSNGLCGGWGDRQEGLVTVFLLAYLTRRRFGILMDTPCPVSSFIVPNYYDWRVTDAELKGKSMQRVYAIDRTSFSNDMSTMDFNARYPQDVVYLQTNRDLWQDIRNNPHYRHMLPAWANHSRPEFFSRVWKTLMKPSPALEARLKAFLDSVHYFNRTRPLVGLHVRTGGSKFFSDGVFGDRLKHLDALWAFLRPYVGNGSELFIATDNPAVREQSLGKFGPHHHDTQVALRHIDRQRTDPEICQAFEGAILDQLILTYCDVLVVSPGSGFSSRAAMIRGMNQQLFGFGKDIHPENMYRMCEPIC